MAFYPFDVLAVCQDDVFDHPEDGRRKLRLRATQVENRTLEFPDPPWVVIVKPLAVKSRLSQP